MWLYWKSYMCTFESSSTLNPTKIGRLRAIVCILHWMIARLSLTGSPRQKLVKVYHRLLFLHLPDSTGSRRL